MSAPNAQQEATNPLLLALDPFTSNTLFIGFIIGLIFAFLVAGFILTENPKHIPAMIKHSGRKGFVKVTGQSVDGTYSCSYAQYLKRQQQVRALFLISIICFCAMVASVLAFG